MELQFFERKVIHFERGDKPRTSPIPLNSRTFDQKTAPLSEHQSKNIFSRRPDQLHPATCGGIRYRLVVHGGRRHFETADKTIERGHLENISRSGWNPLNQWID